MGLDFDGSNDQVSYGDLNSIDGAAALTIMCWHVFDVYPTPGILLGKEGSMEWQFLNTPSLGKWACVFGANFGTSTNAFNATGTSRHFAMVFDGSGGTNAARLQEYVNGVAETIAFTGTIPATVPSTTAIFEVGGRSTLFSDQKVSHLKVWLAALTAAEVADEMFSYHPVRTANLLIWSPFDDGQSVRDYSGNGNHGSLVDVPVPTPGPAGVMPRYGLTPHRGSRRSQRFSREGGMNPFSQMRRAGA